MTGRELAPLALLAISAGSIVGVGAHARARALDRSREQVVIDRVLVELPGSDLALAGAARHLRFPSLEDPGAAFADGPATPDIDPGGGAMAPPREVYAEQVRGRPSGVAVTVHAR